MAKIMEMEVLETCPLGGLFKLIFKMIDGYLPPEAINKNIFGVPKNQFENIFGLR